MSPEQFKQICPRAHDDWVAAFIKTMPIWEVTTPIREAAFVAQFAVETDEYTVFEENLNYSVTAMMRVWPSRFPTPEDAAPYARNPEKLANRVYDYRRELGNTYTGDGWRFRGRGPQLTGRANYAAAGKALDLPLVDFPEMVGTPEVGSRVAGWFWYSRGCSALADAGDFEGITKKINGGLTGYQERLAYFNKAKATLGINENS